ncbi:toprim domain-containing protein [Heliobacterium undosum]|uniref:Toprim domain-containing protein n=1 Tax=Heliomicrobium undosum TaxID=121734 RepID=A0A845L2E9_9FIRM|nr:toprim domain-containing protein [Heliomicrobium undosum]MZP28670.1 toprim domain-containing protein [Heliomicrobium undosum]
MITLHGQEIEVDIASELRRYDWNRPRWTDTKLLACSPFRPERHPSFAIRLDTGVWIDSGGDDPEWKKGNLPRLLSWLRNETYEETVDYLLTQYGVHTTDVDSLQLKMRPLSMETESWTPLHPDILVPYRYRHPYLEKQRGLSEQIQRFFNIGYDRKRKAITFPWQDRSGHLVNIKYRSVRDKIFWYQTGGQPIRNHIYGLNHVIRLQKELMFIVESEIDAITLWEAGYGAVALGGAHLSARQRDLIIQSPVKEVVIATDNDLPGRRLADSIIRQLGGYLSLRVMEIPEYAKDVNELPRDVLLHACQSLRDVELGRPRDSVLAPFIAVHRP